jgi:glutamine synthetase adenylyltransferase
MSNHPDEVGAPPNAFPLTYDDLTATALAPLGFDDPARAARILRSLSGQGVSDALFERLLPHLLHALARSADPDRAVNNWQRWAENLHGRATTFGYLAEHPPAVWALVTVFAASQYFANVLIAQPEWAEAVMDGATRARRTGGFAALYRDVSRAVDVFNGPGGKRTACASSRRWECCASGRVI